MTAATARRATITAWQRSRYRGVVKGPVAAVHPILRAHEIPWAWDVSSGAYIVPLRRFDALLAALELAGHRVDFIDGRHYRWTAFGSSRPEAPPPDALW